MPVREDATRMRLQIPLKCSGAIPIVECGGGSDLPRPEFGRMNHFARVMFPESLIQIVRQPGVMSAGIRLALEDVYIGVMVHGLPGRSSERSVPTARLRPPALRSGNFAGAGFLLRCAPDEAWCRRRESNPHARYRRWILSPVRLPFRHSGAGTRMFLHHLRTNDNYALRCDALVRGLIAHRGR